MVYKSLQDKRGRRMTNKNAIKQLKMLKEHLKNDMYADDQNAINKGIEALELLGHLTDRPCSACEFRKEKGCSQWNCVFDKIGV